MEAYLLEGRLPGRRTDCAPHAEPKPTAVHAEPGPTAPDRAAAWAHRGVR
jgi:hypothetical protein